MKILLLNTMPLYPVNNGAKLRVWNLLKLIAKHHEVTCIAMHTDTDEPDDTQTETAREFLSDLVYVKRPLSRGFRIVNGIKSLSGGQPFTYLNFYFPVFAEAIIRVMSEKDFDLVHAHHIHTLQYLDLFKDKAILLESHGIASEQWRLYGLKQRNPLRKYFCLHQANLLDRVEEEMNRSCDAVISCSERDKEQLENLCPEVPNVCIPNGVDTEYFIYPETEEERHSLVYTSAFDYVPNADAVVHFARNVFPNVTDVTATQHADGSDQFRSPAYR